jgi:hypothetical protein
VSFFVVFVTALAFLGPFGALPIWVAFSCANFVQLESARVDSPALEIELESGCANNALMVVAPKLV